MLIINVLSNLRFLDSSVLRFLDSSILRFFDSSVPRFLIHHDEAISTLLAEPASQQAGAAGSSTSAQRSQPLSNPRFFGSSFIMMRPSQHCWQSQRVFPYPGQVPTLSESQQAGAAGHLFRSCRNQHPRSGLNPSQILGSPVPHPLKPQCEISQSGTPCSFACKIRPPGLLVNPPQLSLRELPLAKPGHLHPFSCATVKGQPL